VVNRSNALLAGALLVAVAAIAVCVVTFAAARGWMRGDAGTYTPPATLIAARIDPASTLFGDVVLAHASVIVDTGQIDPATVSVTPKFVPFQLLSSVRHETRLARRAVEIVFDYRLQCLTSGCISAMEREQHGGARVTVPIRFAPAAVVGRGAGGMSFRQTLRWPELVMHSRLTAEVIASGNPHAEPLAGVPISYRVRPALVGWLSIAAFVALVAVGAALLVSALRRLRRPRTIQIRTDLTPVEQALVLARAALERGHVADARRALYGLAAAFAAEGREEHAVTAERLAWSAPAPSGESVEELAQGARIGGDGA
jgi:hypothetical protein